MQTPAKRLVSGMNTSSSPCPVGVPFIPTYPVPFGVIITPPLVPFPKVTDAPLDPPFKTRFVAASAVMESIPVIADGILSVTAPVDALAEIWPEVPVSEMTAPVQFDKFPLVGVPRIGVTSVGLEPNDVRLEPVTVELSVVPVSVAAAAVTVISAEPLNETPFIFLAVCNVVAVPALPETEV